MSNGNDTRVIRTICNSHCGGTCEIKVHVKDGKIVHLESVGRDDLHHRACARGLSYRQRVYSPDRLLYPLKRTGTRGTGEFARVSWDEALDTVAREMKRVKDVYGNAAILHFCSMADPYILHHLHAIHRLLCMFGGYTAPWGTMSFEGFDFSSGITFGTVYGIEREAEDYLNAGLVIMWGWNPVITMQGSDVPLALIRAKESGARIIAVDPRYTDTAALVAGQWIPIRPGSDVAALLAMAYVIISENLHDKKFIDECTVGFDKFAAYLNGHDDGIKKTPQWAERITGIPAASLEGMARDFARIKPAVLTAGYAAGRTAFGEQFHRAIAGLEAITGNTYVSETIKAGRSIGRALRKSIQLSSPPNPVETGKPSRWNALSYRGASVNSSARVNISIFADAILKGKSGGYPADYKLLWLSTSNYLNQLGDINKAVQAFNKLEFFLITEQFMTSTARFADIILPTNTYLERNDVYASQSGDAYGLLNKAIEPLGESRSLFQICSALAAKLGITDYNDKSEEQWLKTITTKLAEDGNLPVYEVLREQGIQRYKSTGPAAASQKEEATGHKIFPTPSGKVEIYSKYAEDMRHPQIPSIPQYIEPWESRNDPLAEKYPLQLITSHFRWRAHSQFHNMPWLCDLQPPAVYINPADANARGIGDGETVRIFNNRGEVRIPASLTERIIPGVVEIQQGAWYNPDKNGVDYGGCANVLTTNNISPAGAFACNTSLVQVEKIG